MASQDNNNDGKNGFQKAFSVWDGRGKVAYSTYAQEDIHIPKGAKILFFRNNNATPQNRQPSINVVYVVEDGENKTKGK